MKETTTASKNKIAKNIDCGWKRLPCGKKNCLLCGGKKENSIKIRKKKDLSSQVENIRKDFKKVSRATRLDSAFIIQEIRKKKEILETPGYNLFEKINAWRMDLLDAYNGMEDLVFLKEKDAILDSLWYANILAVRIFWQHEKAGEKNDYYYNNLYVLEESLNILKGSLEKLIEHYPGHKKDLSLPFIYITGLEKEILNLGANY